MSNPTPDLSSLTHDTCCAAAAVVSFGTHLLTAHSSAAPSERCLRLRLAVDNLLLVSSVGKVQQGSSLSRAATSSISRSVAHYTQKHVSDFSGVRGRTAAPRSRSGRRYARTSGQFQLGSLGWEGLRAGQRMHTGKRGKIEEPYSLSILLYGAESKKLIYLHLNLLAIKLLLHLRVKMCRKMDQRPPPHRHIDIVLAPLIFFLSESLNPSEELKSK
ncbi:uncharacterized protein [Triticum aestivum]|uniref:uncharacterized protein isoform X1 n=1 Tax=Triticum aestivum TaxID=4565 RepID=UPI001D017E95|nr:uncharacterized protein LOC123166300 isoform X1 [Triticum aestivum]